MAYDIFISFHYRDNVTGKPTRAARLAEDLYNDLERSGYSVFYAPATLNGMIAEKFIAEINSALESAKVLVLIYSTSDEVRAKHVEHEWSTFHRSGKSIIPVMIDVKTEDWPNIPRTIAMLQGYDLTDDVTCTKYMQLLEGIEKKYEQGAPAVPKAAALRKAHDPSAVQTPVILQQPAQQNHALGNAPVKVGEKVEFGRYLRTPNATAPILWRVLDVIDGKALLLSERLIDCRRYNGKNESVSWETCTLRKWLNGEFMQTAFSADEQSSLCLVRNPNPDNQEYDTYGGLDTDDYVFCLSISEVTRYFERGYFGAYPETIAKTTEVARKNGAYSNDNYTGYWWLRSPGKNSHNAAYVTNYGHIEMDGRSVADNNVCIRPAILVQL